MAWLSHHELVPVRVDAHREVKRVFGSVVGFAGEVAAVGFELFDRGAEVFDLEGEPSPSAFALSAPVNTDDAVGHLDLGPDFRLHSDLSIKEIAIKGDGTLPIGGPESIFGF